MTLNKKMIFLVMSLLCSSCETYYIVKNGLSSYEKEYKWFNKNTSEPLKENVHNECQHIAEGNANNISKKLDGYSDIDKKIKIFGQCLYSRGFRYNPPMGYCTKYKELCDLLDEYR